MNAANPYAPPRADVADVPRESTSAAGRGTRLVAAILDSLIVMGMVYLPLFVGVGLDGAFQAAVEPQPDPAGAASGFGLLLAFIGFVAWCWLTVLFVSRNGQSIGKKLLSIKVVRADGSPASLGRIFWLRNVVNGLLGIIPLYALIDVLVIFGEPQQCIHDKIADTIVIKA